LPPAIESPRLRKIGHGGSTVLRMSSSIAESGNSPGGD
jgi:hypothetical protein